MIYKFWDADEVKEFPTVEEIKANGTHLNEDQINEIKVNQEIFWNKLVDTIEKLQFYYPVDYNYSVDDFLSIMGYIPIKKIKISIDILS